MSAVTKVIDSFYNNSIGKKLANPTATAATAAAIATVSNVSKDAVNCAYYTIQSLNNDRIPESQRKFVGALDLSNGIINVLVQVLMAFGIGNAITSIFDRTIGKTKPFSTSEPYMKQRYAKLPEELRKTTTYENYVKGIKPLIEKNSKMARLGFTVLTVNIAMQILTKRIITPLIATPLASVFKKMFEDADAKKAKETKETQENHVIAKAA